MQFPAYFLLPDGTVKAFHHAVDFQYIDADGESYTYPAQVWGIWTGADWSAVCPDWRRLDYVDEPPVFDPVTQVLTRKAQDGWTVNAETLTLTVGYVIRQKTADELTADEIGARPPVPEAVTNFQARAALLAAGLFDQVNDALLAQPVNSTARQAWEYANELTRNGTLVNSVSATLGLTSAQLDDLFRQAATIEA